MARARIIIADDDVEIRRWLRVVLRPLNADVVEVGSGAELLLALAESPFDVVISDVWMPPPDGIQAAAAARTAGISTPFIVITSCTNARVRSDAERIPGTTLLYKPLDHDEVRHRVAELLGHEQPAPAQRREAHSAAASLRSHRWPALTSLPGANKQCCPSCSAELHQKDRFCASCRVQARPYDVLDRYDDVGGSG